MAAKTASMAQVTPHRCNDRLEDALRGLTRFPPRFGLVWGNLARCLRSEEGNEPVDAYRFISVEEARARLGGKTPPPLRKPKADELEAKDDEQLSY
eukprot:TRINITY_DN2970_c0_g1_i1.p1 TRINITY_DN2970_c0_g1~~TRINITY_DN2970_c0_g1_i1.p1  ORF type:complete len:111 (+),score=22.79 TRINITY_DN2970_c0_g1_i1:46-333(+)